MQWSRFLRGSAATVRCHKLCHLLTRCIQARCTYLRTEELALDPAVKGRREHVFRALLAHPLIGQHDLADKLTDLLISANRDHLWWAA